MTFPVDSAGATFDPAIHTITKNGKPQYSPKQTFIKLKGDKQNTPEAIKLFEGNFSDEKQEDDIYGALAAGGEVAPPAPPAAPADEIVIEAAPSTGNVQPEGYIHADDDDIAIDDPALELGTEAEGFVVEDAPKAAVQKSNTVTPQELPKTDNYKGELQPGAIRDIQAKAIAYQKRADFSAGYNLEEIDLSDADLRGAMFNNCNLKGANLKGANLMGVNFTGATLAGADIRGADLRFCYLPKDIAEAIKDDQTKLDGAV